MCQYSKVILRKINFPKRQWVKGTRVTNTKPTFDTNIVLTLGLCWKFCRMCIRSPCEVGPYRYGLQYTQHVRWTHTRLWTHNRHLAVIPLKSICWHLPKLPAAGFSSPTNIDFHKCRHIQMSQHLLGYVHPQSHNSLKKTVSMIIKNHSNTQNYGQNNHWTYTRIYRTRHRAAHVKWKYMYLHCWPKCQCQECP